MNQDNYIFANGWDDFMYGAREWVPHPNFPGPKEWATHMKEKLLAIETRTKYQDGYLAACNYYLHTGKTTG